MKTIMIVAAALLALTVTAQAAGGIKPNATKTSSSYVNKSSFFD